MTQEQCTSGKTAPCCLVSSRALSDGHLCAPHKWGPARTPASHLGYPWVEQDGFESHSLEMLRCLFLKGSVTHGAIGALLLRQCFPVTSVRQTMEKWTHRCRKSSQARYALGHLDSLSVVITSQRSFQKPLLEGEMGKGVSLCFFPDSVAPVLSLHSLCGHSGLPEPDFCLPQSTCYLCHI